MKRDLIICIFCILGTILIISLVITTVPNSKHLTSSEVISELNIET